MKKTVSFYDFEQEFRHMERIDSFTFAGLHALFDYLEQLEEDIGEEIELDVIALCCEYSEYSSVLEAAKDLGFAWDPEENSYDEDEEEQTALDWLNDRTHTTVIPFDGGVIIQDY